MTLETYVRYLFHGKIIGGEVALMALSNMWKVRCGVVTLDDGLVPCGHDGSKKSEVVITHNGRDGALGHFSATGDKLITLLEVIS